MSVQTIQTRSPFPQRTGYVRSAVAQLTAFVCYFITCLNVARQRRKLQALDEDMLKDIGVSTVDAYRESSRSFWDVPSDLGPGRQRRY